ncbi:hypothetical protein CJA_2949 [Cellvibrio japonicus Ueda107]|uniref:Uncharacterized protein n=1 Tax=Cellvibrio japonicus (strain Ueda107) TaxID=498211 RepID=B3PCP0_CELJU|nr:hypothetical protein CJA_2949 [Cellvibrio japonicus Ueda107]
MAALSPLLLRIFRDLTPMVFEGVTGHGFISKNTQSSSFDINLNRVYTLVTSCPTNHDDASAGWDCLQVLPPC